MPLANLLCQHTYIGILPICSVRFSLADMSPALDARADECPEWQRQACLPASDCPGGTGQSDRFLDRGSHARQAVDPVLTSGWSRRALRPLKAAEGALARRRGSTDAPRSNASGSAIEGLDDIFPIPAFLAGRPPPPQAAAAAIPPVVATQESTSGGSTLAGWVLAVSKKLGQGARFADVARCVAMVQPKACWARV